MQIDVRCVEKVVQNAYGKLLYFMTFLVFVEEDTFWHTISSCPELNFA